MQARPGARAAQGPGIERVRLHADLTILTKLACALARARAVPLAQHTGTPSTVVRMLGVADLARLGLAQSLAILTAGNYLIWLGWDQHYDVGPRGVVTGPYQEWQVVGLAFGLAALASFAGWRQRPEVGVAVIPTVMTLCFSIDAATQIDTYGASLWPIGAALVAVGTLAGVAVVAHLMTVAASSRRRAFR